VARDSRSKQVDLKAFVSEGVALAVPMAGTSVVHGPALIIVDSIPLSAAALGSDSRGCG